jgi:uncharacterized protein YcnI/copper(I)-binding protein
MRHLFLQFAAATALTAASLATANAHATLEKAEAAPGAYKAVIRIGHGCDGQPTRSVRVEVPEGYVGVRPQPKAGWSIEIERGDYAHAYTLHGRDVASGVKAVTWTGGLLDDAYYDEFVMAGTLAAATGGHSLFFKTLQTCDEGKVAWEEIPASGQDPHSLDHPAPGLVVLAASDNDAHGQGHGAAHGHDHDAAAAGGAATTGDLEIEAAWARATLAGQKAAGGYLTIANKGSAADRLVGASSPLAGKVEIHTMEVVNNVMTMRPVDGGLEIPAGGSVELKPGGLHLMFMDMSAPFTEGETVPVTLQFEKAEPAEVELPVRTVKGGGHGHDHGDGDRHDHGADHGDGHDHGKSHD